MYIKHNELSDVNFPPKMDISRINKYHIYHALFRGLHKFVYVDSGLYNFTFDDNMQYLCLNYCGAMTKLLVSRLFSEKIVVKTNDYDTQLFLEYLIADTNLQYTNILAATNASYNGDAVYKIWYDGNEQKIHIDTIDPATCFPETDPLDSKKIIKCTISNILTHNKELYLWNEIHEMIDGLCWIRNELYSVKTCFILGGYNVDYDTKLPLSTIPQTASLSEEINTGLDSLLIVWVGNDAYDCSGIYGISDYENLLSIQGELNHRYNQTASVLNKHAEPFLQGPADMIDEDGTVRIDANRKFVALPEGESDSQLSYITWNAQLQSSEAEIDALKNDFASIAMIDLSLLVNQESNGNPQSGRALKLSQTRTQARVKLKQLFFENALREVFVLCTKLAQIVPLSWGGPISVIEPTDISIVFSDGLPNDTQQDIEEQILMVESGLQSKIRAIMKLHGVNESEAQKILDEIGSETSSNTQVVSSPFDNLTIPETNVSTNE